MKYLMWLLNAAIFFVLFAFALNNQEAVTLNLFLGASWKAPMVLVLLMTLIAGVFLGVIAMLPLWLRARKRARAHALKLAAAESAAPAVSPGPRPHGS